MDGETINACVVNTEVKKEFSLLTIDVPIELQDKTNSFGNSIGLPLTFIADVKLK
ncbi:MAG: hypothetical protein IPJ74_21120 [Saprospiraceae bacterium]|nr:hypothetical protein [Saprospiraceae bacterium]